MDRDEIAGKYAVVRNAGELVDAYAPLLSNLGAKYVSIQVASADPVSTIELVGAEVLPKLRAAALNTQPSPDVRSPT